MLDRAESFGESIIEPNAEAWDRAGSVPRSFFEQAGADGLCGLIVPRELGGQGLAPSELVAVSQALAKHCMASAFALVVHNNFAGALARLGSDEVRERFLPGTLAGTQIGAFLLTEPDTGSDATAITTRATRKHNGWLIEGEKAWVSNASNADVLHVFAQTEPGSGANGIASFLIPADTVGVERLPAYRLLGGHALGTGGIRFNQCEIHASAVLCPPGKGFAAAMSGIDLARINVAAMCCGALERALAESIGYTSKRAAFDAHLADFQGVQWGLSDCATNLEAARGLTSRAASLLDHGERATLAAAHAKKFATRVAFSDIAQCMQLMGATGLDRSRPLARLLEGAKIAQYLDGATEVQNVVISRNLVREYANGSAESAENR